MRLAPIHFQVIGNELAIAWNDGIESFLALPYLRRCCPCAACGGEPDVMGRIVRPEVTYTDRSFELASIVPIGGYAFQPHWKDDHGTGLYSFDYLRRIAAAGAQAA